MECNHQTRPGTFGVARRLIAPFAQPWQLTKSPFREIGQRSGRLAQLDRALASGAKGHRFESCNAH